MKVYSKLKFWNRHAMLLIISFVKKLYFWRQSNVIDPLVDVCLSQTSSFVRMYHFELMYSIENFIVEIFLLTQPVYDFAKSDLGFWFAIHILFLLLAALVWIMIAKTRFDEKDQNLKFTVQPIVTDVYPSGLGICEKINECEINWEIDSIEEQNSLTSINESKVIFNEQIYSLENELSRINLRNSELELEVARLKSQALRDSKVRDNTSKTSAVKPQILHDNIETCHIKNIDYDLRNELVLRANHIINLEAERHVLIQAIEELRTHISKFITSQTTPSPSDSNIDMNKDKLEEVESLVQLQRVIEEKCLTEANLQMEIALLTSKFEESSQLATIERDKRVDIEKNFELTNRRFETNLFATMESKAKIEELNQSINQLQHLLSQEQIKNASFLSKNNDLRNKMELLIDEISRKQDEIKALEQKLFQRNSELGELRQSKSSIEGLETKYEQATALNSIYEQRLLECTNILTIKDSEISRLMNDLSKLESLQLTSLQEANDSLKKQEEQFSHVNKKISSDYDQNMYKIKKERDAIQQRFEMTSNMLEKEKNRCELITGDVCALQEKLESTKKILENTLVVKEAMEREILHLKDVEVKLNRKKDSDTEELFLECKYLRNKVSELEIEKSNSCHEIERLSTILSQTHTLIPLSHKQYLQQSQSKSHVEVESRWFASAMDYSPSSSKVDVADFGFTDIGIDISDVLLDNDDDECLAPQNISISGFNLTKAATQSQDCGSWKSDGEVLASPSTSIESLVVSFDNDLSQDLDVSRSKVSMQQRANLAPPQRLPISRNKKELKMPLKPVAHSSAPSASSVLKKYMTKDTAKGRTFSSHLLAAGNITNPKTEHQFSHNGHATFPNMTSTSSKQTKIPIRRSSLTRYMKRESLPPVS